MSISAEVRPTAIDGEWLVFLDVEGLSFEAGGYEEVKWTPTKRVADGQEGRLAVGSQGHE